VVLLLAVLLCGLVACLVAGQTEGLQAKQDNNTQGQKLNVALGCCAGVAKTKNAPGGANGT
jgi:hypothetical protein